MATLADNRALSTGALAVSTRGHPLLEKCTFEQLHRNEVIETRPQILHFGGFQIHKEHSHVLRIINISSKSLRVSIIDPATPHFAAKYDKKGLLAPGMSEEILVTFEPHEWRYYYDTVKIFCGDLAENLVVPIHAYPSANDITLPRIIDFGSVPLGIARTKVIPLNCKIPIQFEFEITVLEAHSDFTISPLTGIIPPDGTAEVSITFLPTKHRTARTELQFNISQFDFDPVMVSVLGSSRPELAREEILHSAQAELNAVEKTKQQEELASKVKKLQDKKTRSEIQVVMPTLPKEVTEREVGGVKVPSTRFDAQATSFVLNQTSGKRPLKDLSAFIREQRKVAEKRREKAEAGEKTDSPRDRKRGGDDLEEDQDDDRQARELRFEMRYREVERYDREKELRSVAAPGQDPPSEAAKARAIEERKQKQLQLARARMQSDMSRTDSVLSQECVGVPNSYRPAVLPAWDENASDRFSMRKQVTERFVRCVCKLLIKQRMKRHLQALKSAQQAANVIDKTTCAAWVEAENRAAATGTNLAGRSSTTGPSSKPQVKKRSKSKESNEEENNKNADKSSNDLADKAKINGSAADPSIEDGKSPASPRSRKQSEQGRTKRGNAAGANENFDDDDSRLIVEIRAHFILSPQMPTMQSGMSAEERHPVEVTPLGSFKEFRPAQVQPRVDYKVLQYCEHRAPPLAAYMQPHAEKSRLRAALEEELVRAPRGEVYDGAEVPISMPSSCLLAPEHDAMSLLVPSTAVRTYVRPPDFTEADFEYRLSQPPPPVKPLEFEPLLPPDLVSLERPWLQTWRQTRRLQDPFALCDPWPASFAEAGGSQGPRLGSDSGGERFAFLPVGGFARDIPSDTDSDDRDDEGKELLPAPPDNLLEDALKNLSGPIISDRWQKETELQERLRARQAASNRAVRDRLNELNKDVSPGNKLYLG